MGRCIHQLNVNLCVAWWQSLAMFEWMKYDERHDEIVIKYMSNGQNYCNT
jgi:hypothetical protein